MNKFVEGLNKEQKAAVLHTDGPLVLIAGAGSGKTRTLTHKIAYLISLGVPSSKILALTFTNKASKEMRERVEGLIGEENESTICTFHSLCVRILRREIKVLDYPSDFNILDEEDQKLILKNHYKKLEINLKDFPYKSVLSSISNWKIKRTSPDVCLANAWTEKEKTFATLYKAYVEELNDRRSLDFDDLLLFTHHILLKYEDIAQKWAGFFDYIFVDEFQDTSHIQYDIIKVVAQKQNITIVGDPDQNIYSWRHADSALLKKFASDFRDTQVLKLTQNYRSTKAILELSNRLISHNTNRMEKDLFTDSVSNGEVGYYDASDQWKEGKWVAQKIDELINGGKKRSEIVVLYRSHYLSRMIEDALVKRNIPYIIFGGVKFYSRKEIKDITSIMKLINNGDDLSMLRMINTPARGIGAVSLGKIIDAAAKANLGLFEFLSDRKNEANISSKSKVSLFEFIDLILDARKDFNSKRWTEVIENILEKIDYQSEFNDEEWETRFENIQELFTQLNYWQNKNADKDISEFLQEISLYTDQDSEEDTSDVVTLMTIHSSKGLEFETVFIAGFNEEIFPSRRVVDSRKKSEMNEERRLAYVAATRAKENLFITFNRGYHFDGFTQKKPSRFLKEFGDIKRLKSYEEGKYSYNMFSENNDSFDIGDHVFHKTFGEGVIVNAAGDILTINFRANGIKNLMSTHISLRKV